MYIPIAPASLRRVRFILRKNLPQITSAHIAEALASSLGFNTAISCAQTSSDSLPGAWAHINVIKFKDRLFDLGYQSSNYEESIIAAHSAINGTIESKKAHFAHLIWVAVDHEATDVHMMWLNTGYTKILMRINRKISQLDIDNKEFLNDAILALAPWFEPTHRSGLIDALSLALPKNLDSIRLASLNNDCFIFRLKYCVRSNSLEGLGFHSEHSKQIQQANKSNIGITLVTGPTGSGKSTTSKFLSQFLFSLTFDGKNKIENYGEIRDFASADLVFKSAMLGHQSQVTLHSNDVFSVFSRLLDIGANKTNVYDETLINCVISQRLISKVCKKCAIPFVVAVNSELLLDDVVERVNQLGSKRFVSDVMVANHSGCESCNAGYRGKRIVAEVIRPNGEFMELMRSGLKREAEKYWREHLNGFTMLEHAVLGVLRGEFDPRDVEERLGILPTQNNFRNLTYK